MEARPQWDRPSVAALVLLAAGAVYAACLGYVFFGRVGDDSRHWLAALSVLQGRYVDLAHPDLRPLAIPPPGYPLLLAPAAALGSIRLAQWMNVAFLLAGLGAVLRLLRREPALALAAAGLAAFNPLTVLQAGPLMADPAFFALSFAALATLVPALEHPEAGARRALASALLAAAAAWVRPQGAALVAACGLALLEDRQARRLAWIYLAPAVALGALPYVWIVLRSDPTTTYFAHLTTTTWRQDSAALELARTIGSNLRFYASAVTTRGALSWVAPLPWEDSWAALAVAAALLAALAAGLRRAFEERGGPRLLATYLVLYLGLHLFWTNQFRRYVFPVLPLLYWLLLRPWAGRREALAAWALPLLLLFAGLDGMLAWHAHVPRPNENVPPRGTIDWLQAHTRAGDVLAARYRETFAVHTGRFAIDVGMAADPDDWLHELARYRVRFVVNHPEGETMESVRQDKLRASARLVNERLSDAARFTPVFRAAGEPFLVYELLDAERFERGYGALLRARAAIAAGDLQEARRRLADVEATGAALTRLPFYVGTTEMLMGRPRQARKALEEAVRREPDFAPARLNLARVGGS